MPPFETMDLSEYAVLREKKGIDSYGQFKVSETPIEIRVRWLNSRTEGADPEGIPIAIEATVIVDRKILEGSLMRQGRLTDEINPDDPDSTWLQVSKYKETPDLKGRNKRRSVSLTRFSNSLPETE